MDMGSKEHWFARLTISGVKAPIERNGSYMRVMSQFVEELKHLNPRALMDGKRITIELSDRPFTEAKLSKADQELQTALAAMPIDEETNPRPDESYAAYYDRLVTEVQFHPTNAKYHADMWFDMPHDPILILWMDDEKAKRFRQLQANSTAYNEAMPEEYEMLKTYVKATYPTMVKDITFRTA